MRNRKLIAVLLTATMLTACTEPNGAPGRGIENGGALSKTDVGVAAGVVGGGLIGSTIGGGVGNTVAIIGGGLLGGLLGHEIGSSLDRADQAAYERASQNAMETGTPRTWKSKNGRHGTITPSEEYRDDDGRYCREYTQKIWVSGKAHTGRGTACRQDDGTWRIIE